MKKTIRVLLDILFVIFWVISLIALPVHTWIIQRFGGGISMDQILFHAALPNTTMIQGTFRADVLTILRKAALVFIFILFLMISCKLLRKMFQGKKPILMFLQFCYFLMFALGLFLFVRTVYLYQKDFQLCSSIAGYWKTTELFDHCAVPDKDKIKFPPIRRNCILIFLESMETTYADSKIFGEDLTPGLTALAKKNFSFTGHNQVNGTGWTSAGMTAVLYGLPRLSNLEEGFFGAFGAYQTFMPEMPSLLKIAAAQKYNILFVEGTPLRFQNTDLFFSDIQYKWLQGGEHL